MEKLEFRKMWADKLKNVKFYERNIKSKRWKTLHGSRPGGRWRLSWCGRLLQWPVRIHGQRKDLGLCEGSSGVIIEWLTRYGSEMRSRSMDMQTNRNDDRLPDTHIG